MNKSCIRYELLAIVGGCSLWTFLYGIVGLFTGKSITDPALQMLGVNLTSNDAWLWSPANYFASPILFGLMIIGLLRSQRVRASDDLFAGLLYLLCLGFFLNVMSKIFFGKLGSLFIFPATFSVLSGVVVGYTIHMYYPSPIIRSATSRFLFGGLALGLGQGVALSLFTGAITALTILVGTTVIAYLGISLGAWIRQRNYPWQYTRPYFDKPDDSVIQ